MLNQEVIKQTLDLLETMEEGMDYVKAKLGELNIEATVTVLTDLIEAFTEIEKSISPIIKNLSEKEDKLRKAFDIIVKEYEISKGQKAYEIMQFTLEPAFKNWKQEIENTLKPYILS
ncbi:hypothetical protein SAMN05661008_00006 [Alkalithermobacter thermoalcaliphilus JW-YL-7 = DSM 7308]|uniref:DUF8042 domain-containing protein n=1 Tax=Alkalithermobacter thermoalcaliphilus JW-YL-7 = DSM 7308 TaxID=1121328 RepID=A0A150FS76_CLOPD|nr:hypothetical protein JWYL7_1513 [[Clostridium] paradoxum JW-YL-7 = DSM 7308]SHK32360.1 hypothetical protein SAMN05661008_00006 [[Clostridium] paradoxum JW-YL-7 = DSM 7308]